MPKRDFRHRFTSSMIVGVLLAVRLEILNFPLIILIIVIAVVIAAL